jgi:DNA-binding transcriptional MerR regulator
MDEQYLIHEVAKKTGVSTRTIRYYISEGLLPPPTTRGRYAYYEPEYIDLIRLIRQLKDAYLPLKEIKMLINNITPDRIHDLLKSSETLRRLQQEVGFEAEAADESVDDNSAQGYINNVMQRRLVQRVSEEVGLYNRNMEEQEDPDEPLMPLQSSSMSPLEKPAFIRQRTLAQSEEGEGIEAQRDNKMKQSGTKENRNNANSWQRYEIIEGIEMNIRSDVENRFGGNMKDIITAIRQLFNLI